MDFLDPDKKKKHNRRLLAGYVLIGVAIALAGLVLLFQSYGYDLDHKTGKVIQNGLIFVSSHPESATVYLNGKQKDTTDARYTVPAGSYTVELKRSGYRNWRRSFNLEGGTIERLVYPVLFPEKLSIKDQQQYATMPQLATESPDRRWIIVQQPNSITAFDVFDTNNPKTAPAKISLDASLLTAAAGNHTYEVQEWSTDNRHVLLKHMYADGKFEFIMVDRDTPANSTNLNKLLNIASTKITLRDKRFDQLYIYEAGAGSLKTADTKTRQVNALLTGVRAYKSYGSDTLLYAATDTANPEKVSIKIRDNNKDYLLKTYTESTDFLLDITRFDGHWYAVVGAKAVGRVAIYKDPVDAISRTPGDLPTAFTSLIMNDPQQIVFSANARFILSQSGSRFAVYDAETNRRFYYQLDQALPLDNKAVWMDGHRLLVNNESKVVVFDFDGINKQTLVPIVPGAVPLFDRDYTRLYTLAPSQQDTTKAALTQTALKLNLQ